jgi:hypothetical protein
LFRQINALTSSLLPFLLGLPAKTNLEFAGSLCESEWTHVEQAKHSSTIFGACGRLSTDQLQSAKKLLLSSLRRNLHGLPCKLRLPAREIRNTAPLGNHKVAQTGLE